MYAVGGVAWSRFLTKRISNTIISGTIEAEIEKIREIIKTWYLKYRFNMLITIILSFAIIGITLVAYFFFSINDIVVCIVSVLCIFMLVRTIIDIIKSVIFTLIPNWGTIIEYTSIFFRNIFNGYGIKGAFKNTIHVVAVRIYNDTNGFIRGVHTVFSKLKLAKSLDEISEEAQNEAYSLITGYTVRLITYKVIAFFTYCVIFTVVLRPFVFTHLIKMNVFEIIFYPFTVALPTVIEIIKEGIL